MVINSCAQGRLRFYVCLTCGNEQWPSLKQMLGFNIPGTTSITSKIKFNNDQPQAKQLGSKTWW